MKLLRKYMCQYPLFETLAVIDGQFQHCNWHQQRVNFAFQHYFKHLPAFDLTNIRVPEAYQHGFYRCRIAYNATAYQVAFFPYTAKKICRYHCVETENFDYSFKYSDRTRFNFPQILQNQEVIIINNGWVSDCSIGNLLFLKQGQWYSSQDYLLKGTQLSALLAEERVILTKISAENLFDYEQIMMINALNPFDLARALPISHATIRQ